MRASRIRQTKTGREQAKIREIKNIRQGHKQEEKKNRRKQAKTQAYTSDSDNLVQNGKMAVA